MHGRRQPSLKSNQPAPVPAVSDEPNIWRRITFSGGLMWLARESKGFWADVPQKDTAGAPEPNRGW
jgi:hypothetical protein